MSKIDQFKKQLEMIVLKTEEENFKVNLEKLNLRNFIDQNADEKTKNFQLLVCIILNQHSSFEQLDRAMVNNIFFILTNLYQLNMI